MQVTLGQAQLDQGTRSSHRSHDDRKTRLDAPAHDDMDVRMWSEGEVPWEDEGTHPDGDAFDSLGLWDEQAAGALARHTWEARRDAMAGSLANSHAEAGGNSDPGPASASPVADHARRRWPVADLAADTADGRHRAGAWAQRPSDEDKQCEPAQRPKHGPRRG